MPTLTKPLPSFLNESEVKRHEENGVIVFDEEYVRGLGEFGFDHIGSDYIFKDRDFENKTEVIVAYAKSEKDNPQLRKVRDKINHLLRIQIHAGEWLINGI